MKCLRSIKKLTLCLSLVLSLTILTKNVNAVTITTEVVPTGNSWRFSSGLRCTVDNDGTITTITANRHNECNLPVDADEIFLRNFYFTNTIPAVEGNYYSFIVGYETNEGLHNIFWNPNVPNDDWILFEFDKITEDDLLDYPTIRSGNTTTSWTDDWKSQFWRVTFQAKRTGNLTLMMGNAEGVPRSLMIFNGGQISVSEIFEYVPNTDSAANKLQELHDEEEEQLQDATDDAQDSSDSSQDSIDSASSSLFGVIRGFVTAITSTSAGSCSVNLNTNYGFNLGNVNLCSLNPPAGVTALLSVVAVFFFVPLAWSTVSQIIGMFRSFTN